jgi:hypothetical protein
MLKPNESLMASAAVVTAVYATFQMTLPAVVDERVAPVGDADLLAGERVATWTAAGLVSVVSLLAKDPTIFVLGGLTVVLLSWTHKHAIEVNPLTGRASTVEPRRKFGPVDGDMSTDTEYESGMVA